jgi:hypothetical protein
VELSYEVAFDGTESAIRVTRDAHPLLVSWAIEALAMGRIVREPQVEVSVGRVVFHFLSRTSKVKRSAHFGLAAPVVASGSTQEKPCLRESSSRRSPA